MNFILYFLIFILEKFLNLSLTFKTLILQKIGQLFSRIVLTLDLLGFFLVRFMVCILAGMLHYDAYSIWCTCPCRKRGRKGGNMSVTGDDNFSTWLRSCHPCFFIQKLLFSCNSQITCLLILVADTLNIICLHCPIQNHIFPLSRQCFRALCCKGPPPARPEYDLVCIGLTGSGKTSLLSKLCSENPENVVSTTGEYSAVCPFLLSPNLSNFLCYLCNCSSPFYL